MTARAPFLPPLPVGVRDRTNTATKPELPAVRLPESGPRIAVVEDFLPPDAKPTNAPSPLPRLPSPPPPDSARSPFVSLADYDEDEEEITSVNRQTVVGAPPSSLMERDRGVLMRLDGALAGQAVSVPEDGVQIGRARDCGLRVSDDGISRRHARIFRHEGRFFLEDFGSRNGTFARGQRISRYALSDGDIIQLGPRVSFRFTLTDSRQERLLQQLFESSTRDSLTGAYNRQHFDERLESEIAYAERHQTELSLVLFDVDHFKRVNDTHGHPTGDAVLCHLAGLIAPRLRTEDVFARYGGEEFAVILRGIHRAGAARVGERIRTAVSAKPAMHEGVMVPVTISAGASALTCCDGSSSELVAVADRRLYLAKGAGRNRVVAVG